MTEKQTDDIEQLYRPPYRSLTARGLIIMKEGHLWIISAKVGALKQLLKTDVGHPMITIPHHEPTVQLS